MSVRIFLPHQLPTAMASNCQLYLSTLLSTYMCMCERSGCCCCCSVRFLWQHQQRSTLSGRHTPYMQHAQHMWLSCSLTPPARLRCTGTSKWDTAASRTFRIAATSISGVSLLNFGQDLIGLISRLAGIKALRDRIEHVRCAIIEY